MKLRKQLIGLAAATMGAAVLLSGTVAAETVLKFASFVPPKYVLHKPIFMKMGKERLARCVDPALDLTREALLDLFVKRQR